MKAFTLNDFIDEQKKADPKFACYYDREEVINNIAVMIVHARKQEKLTQSELAKRIGTSQSVISRIERGSGAFIPSLDTLLKIASAMNLKLRLQLSTA